MTYLLVLALLVAAELIYFYVAERFSIVDRPNGRSSHSRVTIRGGGIVFPLGAWLHAAFYGLQYPWFLSGLAAIAGSVSLTISVLYPIPSDLSCSLPPCS